MKVLYIIPRTDLDTMGRGRMAAQASHATSMFNHQNITLPILEGREITPHIKEWMTECPDAGCGTVLVLNGTSLNTLIELNNQLASFPFNIDLEASPIFGIFVDPEYFVPDGLSGHMVKNVPTCLWVFGEKSVLSPILSSLNLLPNDPTPR